MATPTGFVLFNRNTVGCYETNQSGCWVNGIRSRILLFLISLTVLFSCTLSFLNGVCCISYHSEKSASDLLIGKIRFFQYLGHKVE